MQPLKKDIQMVMRLVMRLAMRRVYKMLLGMKRQLSLLVSESSLMIHGHYYTTALHIGQKSAWCNDNYCSGDSMFNSQRA